MHSTISFVPNMGDGGHSVQVVFDYDSTGQAEQTAFDDAFKTIITSDEEQSQITQARAELAKKIKKGKGFLD